MRLVRTSPSLALAAAVLLLGCGGVLGIRLAAAGADQNEFPAHPTPEMRRARAVVPAPLRRVQVLSDRTPAWLRRTGDVPAARRDVGEAPDFASIRDVKRKKVSFFSYLLPLVERENQRLEGLRERLGFVRDHLRWGRQLDTEDRIWLNDLCREFRVKEIDLASDAFWNALWRRVDTLPEELVLVQAANESAWGTSRFAREGNNFFGQWCFSEGCGIVPTERPDGETYEVARFASVEESIGSYMRNLNAGYSYAALRRIRAEHRARGKEPGAHALAGGLMSYSERGQDYVDDIRDMLRYNRRAIDEARSRISVAQASS